MFVSKSRHEREVYAMGETALLWKRQYERLLLEWNALVKRINAHGGEAIFITKPEPKPQFTPAEVDKLIFLCHPDKHNQSETATNMTVRLLKLRGT